MSTEAVATETGGRGAYTVLLATIGALTLVGLVMVLSASAVSSLEDYGSAWYFFTRQLMWCAIGVVAFLVALRIDYRSWQRITVPLLVASAVLLVAVLVPGIGIEVDGARRWLGVGQLRFQPSEVAKLALLVFAADLLTRRRRALGDWRTLKPLLLVFAGFALLVLRQPDLDTTIVLALIVGAALLAGGARLQHLAVLAGSGVALAGLLAIAAPYRRARVLTFLDPWSDPGNTGYQIAQSLIAVGSGGWTGTGLGAGRAKWMFLPNAHTDFIFAIIAEELGFIGAFCVLALFGVLAVVGIRTALRAPTRFGSLLAAGITTWIVGQALINVGMVIGVLPVSGLTLPFVSSGGSSLVFTMLAAGILANIARQIGSTQARAPARGASAKDASARRAPVRAS